MESRDIGRFGGGCGRAAGMGTSFSQQLRDDGVHPSGGHADADGSNAVWALEGASPATLLRDGWSRESVEVSDHITVRCHQLKDRSNGCLLGFLTPEGGVEKEFD